MNDDEFLRAFESCAIPKEDFHHRDHVYLAWILARRHGVEHLENRMRAAIRQFANFHNVSGKYHETITMAWARIVGEAFQRSPAAPFEELLALYPSLLDKQALSAFYSDALLASETAKTSWVEPDLQPLPEIQPA